MILLYCLFNNSLVRYHILIKDYEKAKLFTTRIREINLKFSAENQAPARLSTF